MKTDTQKVKENKHKSSLKNLENKLFNTEEILKITYLEIAKLFEGGQITICLIKPNSENNEIETYPKENRWILPNLEKEWLQNKQRTPGPNRVSYDYIENRIEFRYCDKQQYLRDQQNYQYSCKDYLLLNLYAEDNKVIAMISINNWLNKVMLKEVSEFKIKLTKLIRFLTNIANAFENHFIYQRIQTLGIEKKLLKKRIQDDEEDLRRRVLELTVFNDMSNELSSALQYEEVIKIIFNSLKKVINFDVCSILMIDNKPKNEMIMHIQNQISKQTLNKLQDNIFKSLVPFLVKPINKNSVKIMIQNENLVKEKKITMKEKSTINIPLIFKDEIIGFFAVTTHSEEPFNENEKKFLQTLTSLLTTNLSRIKIINEKEKSKIYELMKSMVEGIIMVDKKFHPTIINPAAKELLNIKGKKINKIKLTKRFMDLGIDIEQATMKSKSFQKEITNQDKILLITSTPVYGTEKKSVGTVIVLRNVTDQQRINKSNELRLQLVAKTDNVINSIADLEVLLEVVMEFILSFSKADLGAIQLKEGKLFQTRVHSNFPDKIRTNYKLNSGETISEYVTRNNKTVLINNYQKSKRVEKRVRIPLSFYLCIPIIIHGKLIGMVNLAKKTDDKKNSISENDLKTIKTVTSLTGTAIYNAILYQDRLKKQQLEQELKVAYNIQTNLLPKKPPNLKSLAIGTASIPAKEMGGDYYDFIKLSKEKTGIVIADMVGKGIPAGLFMATLKSLLNTFIHELVSTKAVVEKINKIITKDPVINKFIPFFYGIFDEKNLTFNYTNAGHEPPIFISDNKLKKLDTEGLPLGIQEASTYEEKSIKLKHQDNIILYTDGIIDTKNEQGENFGEKNLENCIKKLSKEHPLVLIETLLQTIREFGTNLKQNDDITIIAFKVDKQLDNSTKKPLQVKEILIGSMKDNVKVVRQEVELIGKKLLLSDQEIYDIKLAINEAQANVIEHAYQGTEKGKILIKFLVYINKLEIIIKDYGVGINQKNIKGIKNIDELEGAGLGLFLMHALMDEVKFKKTSTIGTELILTKKFKSSIKL